MDEQNNRIFLLNMISTRFCCCNESIRTNKQINEQLVRNTENLPEIFFILELKNILDLEKIEYNYEAKGVLKLFIECSSNSDDDIYKSSMSNNKLNIILPYGFMVKCLNLTNIKSSFNIILSKLFECDIYMTSCIISLTVISIYFYQKNG